MDEALMELELEGVWYRTLIAKLGMARVLLN